MLRKFTRTRRSSRVEPGDGRALQRFRWWQVPGRALFHMHSAHYHVDVRHWQNQSSGSVKADLYRGGRRIARSTLPAAFAVDGGTIEVAMSGAGMKRCHMVTHDGREHQLRPDPASAEGRRARLNDEHPNVSRVIGFASVTMLAIGALLLLLQVAEPLSQIPPIAQSLGTFTSPVALPVWLNLALGVGAAISTVERSLRLRHHWLLDGLGN